VSLSTLDQTLAQSRSGFNDYYWHVIGPTARAEHCREVEPDVDALAEAGLLPTEAQWKTSGEGGDSLGWSPDRASAVASWDRVQEKCAEMVGESWDYEAPTLKRQYVIGWREVA
jgi:hypothetical protein